MDNIIINGDITDEAVKGYLWAKAVESLANAYERTVTRGMEGWYDVNIAIQKAIIDVTAKIKNRTKA